MTVEVWAGAEQDINLKDRQSLTLAAKRGGWGYPKSISKVKQIHEINNINYLF